MVISSHIPYSDAWCLETEASFCRSSSFARHLFIEVDNFVTM